MVENNVFIKVEKYDEILDILDVFKNKLEETKRNLDDIDKIRMEEQEELNSWRSNIEQVDKEINQVSKNLFEMNN